MLTRSGPTWSQQLGPRSGRRQKGTLGAEIRSGSGVDSRADFGAAPELAAISTVCDSFVVVGAALNWIGVESYGLKRCVLPARR